eukprot:3758444-Lingulodinium_polyedra.AAC.1
MRCQWACTACARVRLISEKPLATSDARAWMRRSRSSMPTRTMPAPSKRDSRAMAHGEPPIVRGACAGAGALSAAGSRVTSHP